MNINIYANSIDDIDRLNMSGSLEGISFIHNRKVTNINGDLKDKYIQPDGCNNAIIKNPNVSIKNLENVCIKKIISIGKKTRKKDFLDVDTEIEIDGRVYANVSIIKDPNIQDLSVLYQSNFFSEKKESCNSDTIKEVVFYLSCNYFFTSNC